MLPDDKFEKDYEEYRLIFIQCMVEQEQRNVKNAKSFQLLLKYQFKWEYEVKAEIKARKKIESSTSIKSEKQKKEDASKELKYDQDIINLFSEAIGR